MFKVITLSALAAASATSLEADHVTLFEQFKKRFGRRYASAEEEDKRLSIFRENMKNADKLNEVNGSPVFGVTKFSDKTQEENSFLFGRKGHGKKVDITKIEVRDPHSGGEKWGLKNANHAAALTATTTPTYVNWAATGKTTPVKNQGQCGSCWSFSAAEQVESQWVMAGNAIWEFSPQQIASCTSGTFGCGGGDTIDAFEYIMSLPSTEGLGSAAFAPYVQSMYTACSGPRCTEACSTINVPALTNYSFYTGPYATVTGYQAATPFCNTTCASQDMTLLASNLAVYGPASICVNAASWTSYTGGVLTSAACGGFAYDDLDHCVQLVGFNNQVTPAYWIVRNSWATNWGEDGYIYLEYPANSCGIADEATFVTIGNSQADF